MVDRRKVGNKLVKTASRGGGDRQIQLRNMAGGLAKGGAYEVKRRIGRDILHVDPEGSAD